MARLVTLERREEVVETGESRVVLHGRRLRIGTRVQQLRERKGRRIGTLARLVVLDVLDMADDLEVVLDDPVARVPRGHVVFEPVDKHFPRRLADADKSARLVSLNIGHDCSLVG